MKIVLSVQEVADLIGVSTTTIYKMTSLQEIPFKRIRGRIVFHRETIEKWLCESNEILQKDS